MKQHTLTQTLLVSLLLLTAVIQVNAQASPRKILWIKGPSRTSSQWSSAITSAQLAGYQMSEVNIWPYNTITSTKSIVEWSGVFNQKLTDEGHNNVLGIGHDAGGLILRYMDMNQQGERLSAMILDGVPNQGAGVIRKILPDDNGYSEAQRKIDKLMNLRTQAQNCVGCRMLEATKRWLDDFNTGSAQAYYNHLIPGSPTIVNLSAPNTPHAIIWGNEDEKDALTLTRLVTSWANAGTFGEDSDYIDCYRKELEQRLQEAGMQFLLGTLRSVATLAESAAKFKVTDPLTQYSAIAGFINAAAEQVRSMYNLAKEMREMFECELIHQALNAEWNLMVSQYSVRAETVMVPTNCIPCDDCGNDPDQQVQGYCYSVCDLGCDPNALEPFIYYVYEMQPHDGLLTRDEQLLAGAAKTYEAKKCNHFQEQFWQNQPIADAFNDLFMGGAGAAFVVPK